MNKLLNLLMTLDAVDASIVELEKIRFELHGKVRDFVVNETDIPVLFVDSEGNVAGELDRKTGKIKGNN